MLLVLIGVMHENSVVYITGGAQGIGRGTAVRLLQQGCAVTIADSDAEAGEECMEALSGLGPLLFVRTDVQREQDTAAALERTLERFGRLDGVINNAALADPYQAPIDQLDLETWQRVIDINLTGAFLTAKHAVPYLRDARGSIVNIASTRALQSEANTEPYSATKGGLLALTHAMAISLGPEIRVNAISPGWIDVSEWQKASRREPAELREIDHRQHPAGRVGRVEDVAAMAAYLLSDQAAFITGQNFVVDGGMTRKMIYAE